MTRLDKTPPKIDVALDRDMMPRRFARVCYILIINNKVANHVEV
jgi:hypothetical protein